MYSELETGVSLRHLRDIALGLADGLCLIGGWAVHLLVNDMYSGHTGRSYIGSKDIDLGFHIDPDWGIKDMKHSELFRTVNYLKNKLGFKPCGNYRFVKWFDIHTGQELTPEEQKTKAMFDVFQLYVDPLVDNYHEDFMSLLGFIPIDEDLLSLYFGDKKNRVIVRLKDVEINTPSPPILLATKINSMLRRKEEHKRLKDLADGYALIRFSEFSFRKMKQQLLTYVEDSKVAKTVMSVSEQEFLSVGQLLDIPADEIRTVLYSLL